MLLDPRTWIVVALAASLLASCATTRGASSTGPPQAGEAACERSVEADVETARGRMRDGRLDRALLYVEALAPCPGAVAYGPFLDLALDVYEETGRLNEAWNVSRVRLDRATLELDQAAEEAVRERMDRFRSLYVLIVVDQDGRRPPKVRYAGPVQDEATGRQLKALDDEKGVWIEQGVLGFWLYPGRYEVDDRATDLVPGAVVKSGGGGR
jgi:hypothetical protein